MAWTYSGNPAASDRDWIRFTLQDTTPPGLLQDEEIDAILTEHGGDKHMAAAALADALAMRFAMQASYSVEGLREELSQRAQIYASMAQRLRQRASLRRAVPVSTADNTRPPAFRLGLHDYTG